MTGTDGTLVAANVIRLVTETDDHHDVTTSRAEGLPSGREPVVTSCPLAKLPLPLVTTRTLLTPAWCLMS